MLIGKKNKPDLQATTSDFPFMKSLNDGCQLLEEKNVNKGEVSKRRGKESKQREQQLNMVTTVKFLFKQYSVTAKSRMLKDSIECKICKLSTERLRENQKRLFRTNLQAVFCFVRSSQGEKLRRVTGIAPQRT